MLPVNTQAFVGVAVGMVCAVTYTIIDNRRYVRVAAENGGLAPPETRLLPAIVGAVAIPIGLFWFAWTNQPSLHWIVCELATIPFGFGMVLMFLACMNYLVDSYLIYAASVLAASSVLRSIFGAVFPLFTKDMYADLGIHWASTIPAFLALACLPFPILFYKYGADIRKQCKYAAEALLFLQTRMAAAQQVQVAPPAEKVAEAGGQQGKGEVVVEAGGLSETSVQHTGGSEVSQRPMSEGEGTGILFNFHYKVQFPARGAENFGGI